MGTSKFTHSLLMTQISKQSPVVPPAFESVELRNLTHSSDFSIGSFTSVLVANLSQLERENVSDISCSDPAVRCTLPVNVTIL